jgi:alpha-beta hydrolase superfamily lysophospholipase
VVIATSTGASLAVQAATQAGASEGVAAMALISPNFGVRASGSEILTWPWGGQIAELIAGKTRSFEPRNALQEKLWTTSYPTRAVLPMAALTNLAREAPVEQIKIPALFIFSDSDRITRQDLTREIAARWGAPHELVPLDDTGDPDNHVIAGDALSPVTTNFLAERIVVWVRAILE